MKSFSKGMMVSSADLVVKLNISNVSWSLSLVKKLVKKVYIVSLLEMRSYCFEFVVFCNER